MAGRGFYLYAGFLGLLFAVALGVRSDEAALPAQTTLSWPRVEVSGLRLPAAAGRPAFTAGRAVPASAGGVVQLGGVRDRLRLDSVVVDLAGGWVMHAATGELATDRLSLGVVRIVHDHREVCRAANAEFVAGRVRLPGLSVFTTPGDRSEVDFTGSVGDLLDRLRRRR